MTVLRIASCLMLSFGLVLGIFGVVILSSVNRNMKLLEAMQSEGMGRHIDAQELRLIIIRNAIGYVVVGVLSATSGIGLLFRREWARVLGLSILLFVLGLTAYQLARRLWYGNLDPGDLAYFALTAIPAGALAYYFVRGKTRSFFTDAEVAE